MFPPIETIATMSPVQAIVYLVMVIIPTVGSMWGAKHSRNAAKALTPNHGSSAVDSLARIEQRFTGLEANDEIMTDFIAEIAGKLDHHIKDCQGR